MQCGDVMMTDEEYPVNRKKSFRVLETRALLEGWDDATDPDIARAMLQRQRRLAIDSEVGHRQNTRSFIAVTNFELKRAELALKVMELQGGGGDVVEGVPHSPSDVVDAMDSTIPFKTVIDIENPPDQADTA